MNINNRRRVKITRNKIQFFGDSSTFSVITQEI